eukprot:CCRYP_018898-RA/>CCRYP_018898-RA protein AED:0.38 eAED:0.38 QI:0/0/0/1/0/0/2/0/111
MEDVDEDCLLTFTTSFPSLDFHLRGNRNCACTSSNIDDASVYTDHSLFSFDDIASIILNRVCSVDGFLLIPWWIVFFPGICKLISVLGSNPGVEINIANRRCRNLCFTHLS